MLIFICSLFKNIVIFLVMTFFRFVFSNKGLTNHYISIQSKSIKSYTEDISRLFWPLHNLADAVFKRLIYKPKEDKFHSDSDLHKTTEPSCDKALPPDVQYLYTLPYLQQQRLLLPPIDLKAGTNTKEIKPSKTNKTPMRRFKSFKRLLMPSFLKYPKCPRKGL